MRWTHVIADPAHAYNGRRFRARMTTSDAVAYGHVEGDTDGVEWCVPLDSLMSYPFWLQMAITRTEQEINRLGDELNRLMAEAAAILAEP